MVEIRTKDQRLGFFLISHALIIPLFFLSFFSLRQSQLLATKPSHGAEWSGAGWGKEGCGGLVRFGPVAASQCGEKAGSCFIEKYLPCYLPSTIIT